MTKKALAVYIVFTVLMGLYLFLVRGDMAGKFAACIVCPILIVYLIYVYRKESKADVNADDEIAVRDMVLLQKYLLGSSKSL